LIVIAGAEVQLLFDGLPVSTAGVAVGVFPVFGDVFDPHAAKNTHTAAIKRSRLIRFVLFFIPVHLYLFHKMLDSGLLIALTVWPLA
jgi:hypothetical protein